MQLRDRALVGQEVHAADAQGVRDGEMERRGRNSETLDEAMVVWGRGCGLCVCVCVCVCVTGCLMLTNDCGLRCAVPVLYIVHVFVLMCVRACWFTWSSSCVRVSVSANRPAPRH